MTQSSRAHRFGQLVVFMDEMRVAATHRGKDKGCFDC